MIEVLKQALDALEAQGLNINGSGQLAVKAKYKLRKAIKELESQEPVAWMDVIVVNLMREGINKHRARELAEHIIKLSNPPQRKEG
jgi:CxxC motif-containing protein